MIPVLGLTERGGGGKSLDLDVLYPKCLETSNLGSWSFTPHEKKIRIRIEQKKNQTSGAFNGHRLTKSLADRTLKKNADGRLQKSVFKTHHLESQPSSAGWLMVVSGIQSLKKKGKKGEDVFDQDQDEARSRFPIGCGRFWGDGHGRYGRERERWGI
ncbi:hypothetical protein IE53DRAFT_198164 [Violaceomyces palustris]|uniref:Uncharacterized protein n=1 Tax=Violaceomyces palustris TaxID=1673888 RepID=A0ACD0NRP3_9BASI|nr:hypothetical protein IE53DRAFT_198164 [Violaceomyces palustris]